MELSLDADKNPVLAVYGLFRRPGIVRVDDPSFVGVKNLMLTDLTGARAQELILLLRKAPASALRLCRLRLNGSPVIDFAEGHASEWFLWEAIEKAVDRQCLCADCQGVFSTLRDDLEAYKAGAPWPGDSPEKDCLGVLDALEGCGQCAANCTLEFTLDKSALAREYLLGGTPNLKEGVSALLWYDAQAIQDSFGSFHLFLQLIAQKAEKPLVLFLYEPMSSYHGDYFKILSLSGSSDARAELEADLAARLNIFTPEVLNDYRLLRKRHKFESRPNADERFDLPPSLFTQQKEQLASYPSHPLFDEGPLRSVLVYALMAWLSEVTRRQDGLMEFVLPSMAETDEYVALAFGLTDVHRDGLSIFGGSTDWRAVVGRVSRDIGRSAGNKHLRGHWWDALHDLSPDDFCAPQFFSTLKEVHETFVRLEEKPPSIGEPSPDLIDVLVFLDTSRNEIKFHLNSVSLGYVYKPVGQVVLGGGDEDLPLGELNALARAHLSRVLEPDPDDPRVQTPAVSKLKTRGIALWRKLIPNDLKRAYDSLRTQQDLTMFIISDDPSFPWELVRPFELKGDISREGFDDLWWALQFSIARWLSGSPPPAKEIAMNRVCCVATGGQLAAAAKERDYFKTLGVELDLPQTLDDLIRLLGTKDYDVIHFACHGRFDTENPGESVVQMPSGELLRPDDLFEGEIIAKIDDNHPLVYLNACHSGRTGATLIGLEGWAKQFINLGCGAFIGCGWEVTDFLAAEFAINFYEAFRDGMSMGKSVHHARRENMSKAANNSTWLAYYLYGNPNCRFKK